jgi:hypothetical protein
MSESDDPADQPRYSYKPSLLGSPHEFALTPTALNWVAGRMHAYIPYASIRKIRLSFRPVTMQHYRFIAEIWTDRSPKLTISSTSWKSVVEQERFDSAYTDFVIALHQRLAASGNLPKLERGAMPLLYWPGLVVFFVIGAGLVGLLVKAAMEQSFGALAVVAGFFVIYLWQLGGFFWRNRPGRYPADAVPAEVLPRRKA